MAGCQVWSSYLRACQVCMCCDVLLPSGMVHSLLSNLGMQEHVQPRTSSQSTADCLPTVHIQALMALDHTNHTDLAFLQYPHVYASAKHPQITLLLLPLYCITVLLVWLYHSLGVYVGTSPAGVLHGWTRSCAAVGFSTQHYTSAPGTTLPPWQLPCMHVVPAAVCIVLRTWHFYKLRPLWCGITGPPGSWKALGFGMAFSRANVPGYWGFVHNSAAI